MTTTSPDSEPAATSSEACNRFHVDLTSMFVGYLLRRPGPENWDSDRFGPPRRPADIGGRALRRAVNRLLSWAGVGLLRRRTLCKLDDRRREMLDEWGTGLADTYSLLADQASRRCLLEVLCYRILGPRFVRLSVNTPGLRAARQRYDALADPKDVVDPGFMGWLLYRYDLQPVGIPIRLFARSSNLVTQFHLEHYAYRSGDTVVEAAPKDVVIDGGAAWGDTALYFAHRVGPGGRVLSFEFEDDNVEILRRNLALNPDLAQRVEIDRRALWSRSGESLSLVPQGPGTHISNTNSPHGHRVESVRIDDLPADRIDFIKMDIEGAELEALRGAEETIRRQRPKLAVCLYHSLADFVEVPRYLQSVHPGYRFYLGHFTIHAEETTLFAIDESDGG